MRRFSLAIIAAVSTVALTQIASAADLPRKAPAAPSPPPPVYSWTGFYIGGNIGGGWGHRDVIFSPNDPMAGDFLTFYDVGPATSFKTDGVLGGAQLGYNWQFHRNWLVGLETDFDWSGIKGSSLVAAADGHLGTVLVDERLKWFGTVRGRLGWLPWDNLLVYGTGGFAYGQLEHTGNYTLQGLSGGLVIVGENNGVFSWNCGPGNINPCFNGSSHNTATGWTAGAGIEYAFWQHWSLKAEYLHVSLDNKPFIETAQQPDPGMKPASFTVNFNQANFDVVRVGLNYKIY